MTTTTSSLLRPLAGLLGQLTMALAASTSVAEAAAPADVIRIAAPLACAADSPEDMEALGTHLPGHEPALAQPGHQIIAEGWRKTYPMTDSILTVDWITKRGRIDHLRLQVNKPDGTSPVMFAMIGRECRVESARRMLYGPDNRPERIEVLDAGLAPTGAFELVDPPVPRGTDPGGIPIALVDTGVNYTLDQIAPFLARSPDGALLGYDFWDLDERPFDADAQRSPFYPLRQGTSVASVLLRDAPAARLLVYRYPRPEMPRFTQLIDHAAAAGARIIHLSVATFHSEAWVEFRRAMRDYPDILFIAAAGDDRLDIDFTPVYPAAFRASNLLTVAAARVDGTLTDAANWGAQGVDISVPGHKVPGIGFDGQTQEFTGSPIAAARVSALAVCLLLEDPGLDQLDLKARITELAKWRPPDRPIRHGFIPDDVLAKLTGCTNGEGS